MNHFLNLNREEYNEFVCGFGAAVINISITFPMNKVIFRQVLFKTYFLNIF